MSSYVELYQLAKWYPANNDAGRIVIVDDFTLNIRQGEFVTLIGHSGCGKTTVLNMVAGLSPASRGGMIVGGREVNTPGPDRGVVFQAPNLLPWLTAIGNVQLGVDRVYPHASRSERKELCEYYLALVGLEGAFTKFPKELSRGMQQRVGLARALALQPKLLLLDEPFGMLDALTRLELQDVLIELVQQLNMTTLMVTHDVDEAVFLSDRVVMLTNGPAAHIGQILQVPFERPRTRHDILRRPDYEAVKGELLDFLARHEKRDGHPTPVAATSESDSTPDEAAPHAPAPVGV